MLISVFYFYPSRNDADLKKATALDKERQASCAANVAEMEQIGAQLVKAAEVLRKAGGKGSAGSQEVLRTAMTQIAQTLSVVMSATTINVDSKTKLAALLQGEDGDDEEEEETPTPAQGKVVNYEQHSTAILDLLSKLKAQNDDDLLNERKECMKAENDFALQQQGLQDSSAAQTKAKDDSISEMKRDEEADAQVEKDLAGAQQQLKEDEKLQAETIASCAENKKRHEAEVISRREELEALNQALEILSNPDMMAATDSQLGKKGYLSFVQTDDGRQEASDAISKVARKYRAVELAQLAVAVREGPFNKVMKMIEEMVGRLQKQQAEEQSKKAWCDKETSENEAKRDDISRKVEDLSARIEKGEADSAQLAEDIAKLSKEVSELTAALGAATKLRNDEAVSYAANMADWTTGLEGLGRAIEVLKNYYGAAADVHGAQNDKASGIIEMLSVTETKFEQDKAAAMMQETEQASAFTKLKKETEVRSSDYIKVTCKAPQGMHPSVVVFT